MTGREAVVAALVCALVATACTDGDNTTEIGPSSATEAAASAEATTDGPDQLGQEPTAPQTPTDIKSDVPVELAPASEDGPANPVPDALPDAPPQGQGGAGTDVAAAVQDLSSFALPLQAPEGGFDEGTTLLEEDFQSTTPAILPFETEAGLGGIGSLDDLRFFEMLVNDPAGRVAAPITRLDAVASERVFVQTVSFLSNFSGLAALDRGLYCWASNGNDPLAGARYELLYSTQGQMQLTRYDDSGSPAALLIDETLDFAAANAADPEAPDSPGEATRIGLLCRPDDEGRAQLAVRLDRTYYVTTDAGTLTPGGGAGLVIAGRDTAASTDTIATFDGIFVLDGAQVPLR